MDIWGRLWHGSGWYGGWLMTRFCYVRSSSRMFLENRNATSCLLAIRAGPLHVYIYPVVYMHKPELRLIYLWTAYTCLRSNVWAWLIPCLLRRTFCDTGLCFSHCEIKKIRARRAFWSANFFQRNLFLVDVCFNENILFKFPISLQSELRVLFGGPKVRYLVILHT